MQYHTIHKEKAVCKEKKCKTYIAKQFDCDIINGQAYKLGKLILIVLYLCSVKYLKKDLVDIGYET